MIEPALVEIERQLGVLDRAYGERSPLVGQQVTLADLLLAPMPFYLTAFPESKALLATFVNVQRGFATMSMVSCFAFVRMAENTCCRPM